MLKQTAKKKTIQEKVSLTKPKKLKRYALKHWQIVSFFMMLYDLTAVNGAYFFALWLRYDFKFTTVPKQYLSAWLRFVPLYTVFVFAVLLALRLYRSVWRFASYRELVRVFEATVVTSVFHALVITLLFTQMPLSYYVVGAGLEFMLLISIRFAYRFVLLMRSRLKKEDKAAGASHVMLIGAGSAGQMILRELHSSNQINARVCCIIDDNPNKWNRYIDDVPIVGGREKIAEAVVKYQIQKIYLTIPTADSTAKHDILNICKETGCLIRTLPGGYQLVNGKVTVNSLRDVKAEELLGREPIKVNMDEIYEFINGKVILVTGGGGSIGSELCRQIADHNPKQLIIFDIYENNAHAIGLELLDKHPDLNLKVLIGSVRDSGRLNYIFKKYHPEVVYHAAAHKHVPLMEYSPCEAIKNNAIGTYKTAYAAMTNGCKRFVLISSDKAVNPTGIMGASKRLCEMIIQSFDRKIKEGRIAELPRLHLRAARDNQLICDNEHYPQTEFVAVRFGNVLGSHGSVIPRFKEQIANGGPVTVTHPAITRYFMTIPEAVSLVLEAGIYAKGGEIFVLDMGSPIKIDALARNLIKLSGLKPDVDIKIEYTGLRPGEKLYEEKFMSEEATKTTPNKLIHISEPITFNTDEFLHQLERLMDIAYTEKPDAVLKLVSEAVPTYHPVRSLAYSPEAQV